MLCQVCQKRETTMKITKIVDGTATEFNVCEECASNVSPHHAKIHKKKNIDALTVQSLLKDLLAQGEAGASAKIVTIEGGDFPTCPTCGLEFLRYKQTFMLGCPDCYDAFGEHLLNDLTKIHGATRHVGERHVVASPLLDIQTRLRMLRHELDESVQSEDFDRAVRVRDEIRQLQREQEARIKN